MANNIRYIIFCLVHSLLDGMRGVRGNDTAHIGIRKNEWMFFVPLDPGCRKRVSVIPSRGMDFVEAEDDMGCCTLWRDLRCFHRWHNLFSQEPQRFPVLAKE